MERVSSSLKLVLQLSNSIRTGMFGPGVEEATHRVLCRVVLLRPNVRRKRWECVSGPVKACLCEHIYSWVKRTLVSLSEQSGKKTKKKSSVIGHMKNVKVQSLFVQLATTSSTRDSKLIFGGFTIPLNQGWVKMQIVEWTQKYSCRQRML